MTAGHYRYVRLHRVAEYEAQGWVVLPGLHWSHHDEYSCLMFLGDADETA